MNVWYGGGWNGVLFISGRSVEMFLLMMSGWRARWAERKERRKRRLERRRRVSEVRLLEGKAREVRIGNVRGVMGMKEALVRKGMLALIRVVLGVLERKAKATPNELDDMVVAVLKAVLGMGEACDKEESQGEEE